MVKFFGLVFLYLFIGELVVKITGIMVPATVVALMLLILTFIVRGRRLGASGRNADRLLRYMSLLYVPACTGVITKFDVIGRNWLVLLAVIVVATIIAQFALAIVLNTWIKKIEKERRVGNVE